MNEQRNVLTLADRLDGVSIFRDIVKNLWAILLIALAAAMITNFAVRLNHQNTYATKATLIVKSKTSSTYTYSNLTSASRMADGFKNILNSNLMKKKVREDLGIANLNARMTASVVSETNLMTLSVTADTPRKAYLIIRSVMNNMNDLTRYVSSDLVMEVLQEPTVPAGADAGFSARSQTMKAFLIGAALGVVLFAVLSFLKDTVKNEKDVENRLQVRSIGTIYHQTRYRHISDIFKKRTNYHLITDINARFDFVEQMKKISTNISGHAKRKDEKVIVVTSVAEHEGKSTFSANLALALARTGSVLLIEGDLRRPTLHKYFLRKGERLEKNLGDLLTGDGRAKDVIRYDRDKKFFLMLSQRSYKNSTDIVAGKRMQQMIAAAKKHFDYVVIDTPPMNLMADAEILAGMADMSILVVKSDFTRTAAVNDAIDTLSGANADFYGVVLNDAYALPGTRRATGGYSGYGRYGRYGRYGNYGRYGFYGAYGTYGHYEKNAENAAQEQKS